MIFGVFWYTFRIGFFIFFSNTCSILLSPNAGTENKIGVGVLPQMPNPGKKGAAVCRRQASEINIASAGYE